MVQLNQGDVRRYVGVASTMIGLVCYALSSSFNRLYGDWNSFKICAYIVFSSIICLAILFPKACQGWRIFEYRALFAFLVLTSTTVYSFYLDRKLTTKPDAYGIISSAAFATMSLCTSKSIDCGFLDLMFFFSGVLITQLMEIKPLLGLVGIGVSCFLIIFRSYLDDPVPAVEYLGSQDQYYEVIDIASLQSISSRASSLDITPWALEHNIQNFDANFTALEILPLPSLEPLQRLQIPSLEQLQVLEIPSLEQLRQLRLLQWLLPSRCCLWLENSHINCASGKYAIAVASELLQQVPNLRPPSLKLMPRESSLGESNLEDSIIDFLAVSAFNFMIIDELNGTRILLSDDWIQKRRERVPEIIEKHQSNSWNQVLEHLVPDTGNESETELKDTLELLNMHFKDKCTVHFKGTLTRKPLRYVMKPSLENILLPIYEKFIHRLQNVLSERRYKYIHLIVNLALPDLVHLFRGTGEIDQPLTEKGNKLKLE